MKSLKIVLRGSAVFVALILSFLIFLWNAADTYGIISGSDSVFLTPAYYKISSTQFALQTLLIALAFLYVCAGLIYALYKDDLNRVNRQLWFFLIFLVLLVVEEVWMSNRFQTPW